MTTLRPIEMNDLLVIKSGSSIVIEKESENGLWDKTENNTGVREDIVIVIREVQPSRATS
jgi:hypothetical protein